MDWTPRAALDKATADTVFALEVGQRTQPIPSSVDGTFYIYEVLEKADSREITPAQRTLIEEQSYSDWQETIRQEVGVTAYYYVLTGGQYVPTAIYRELITYATSQGAGVSAQP
jgi:parvulin-like peptidyl-prolyl isomerase